MQAIKLTDWHPLRHSIGLLTTPAAPKIRRSINWSVSNEVWLVQHNIKLSQPLTAACARRWSFGSKSAVNGANKALLGHACFHCLYA